MEQDQEFVEYVLKTVVDNPDDVKIDRTVDEMGVLITVSVNPDDMGKVIGKSGQTAKAVRTLLKVVGAKHDARVNMKIIEPEGSERAKRDDSQKSDDTVQPDDAPQGTTAAADDVPVEETSEAEAVVEQQDTDAAVDQPSENNSEVNEATGEAVAEEPATEQEQDQSTPDALAKERERTPLDEL